MLTHDGRNASRLEGKIPRSVAKTLPMSDLIAGLRDYPQALNVVFTQRPQIVEAAGFWAGSEPWNDQALDLLVHEPGLAQSAFAAMLGANRGDLGAKVVSVFGSA